MGSCLSSREIEIAYTYSTAKVITIKGTLLEYSSAIMVSDVLGANHGTEAFVCSSDELNFDEHIPALSHKVWLELNQIYFILPMAMLHKPLSAQDMVALAAKASLALAGTTLDNRSRRSNKRTIQVVPVREFDDSAFSNITRSTFSGKTKKISGKRAPFRGRRSIGQLNTIEE